MFSCSSVKNQPETSDLETEKIVKINKIDSNKEIIEKSEQKTTTTLTAEEKFRELLKLIKLEHLTGLERQEAEDLIKESVDVYKLPGEKLTYTHLVQHTI